MQSATTTRASELFSVHLTSEITLHGQYRELESQRTLAVPERAQYLMRLPVMLKSGRRSLVQAPP
jgi:hypothetical protein